MGSLSQIYPSNPSSYMSPIMTSTVPPIPKASTSVDGKQQQKANSATFPNSMSLWKNSDMDVTSANGNFGWATIDNVNVPTLLRNTDSFVSVRIVEMQLLSQYPNTFPVELGEHLSLVSYRITHHEQKLLNEINIQHCNNLYGEALFQESDLIVKLEEFEEFYNLVKKTFPEEIMNSRTLGIALPPPAKIREQPFGWLQVNHTLTPYIRHGSKKFVMLPVLRHAAGLLKDVDIPTLLPTVDECTTINQMCVDAGLDFQFSKSSKLVDIDIVREHHKVVSLELPLEKPLAHAQNNISVESLQPNAISQSQPTADINTNAEQPHIQLQQQPQQGPQHQHSKSTLPQQETHQPQFVPPHPQQQTVQQQAELEPICIQQHSMSQQLTLQHQPVTAQSQLKQPVLQQVLPQSQLTLLQRQAPPPYQLAVASKLAQSKQMPQTILEQKQTLTTQQHNLPVSSLSSQQIRHQLIPIMYVRSVLPPGKSSSVQPSPFATFVGTSAATVGAVVGTAPPNVCLDPTNPLNRSRSALPTNVLPVHTGISTSANKFDITTVSQIITKRNAHVQLTTCPPAHAGSPAIRLNNPSENVMYMGSNSHLSNQANGSYPTNSVTSVSKSVTTPIPIAPLSTPLLFTSPYVAKANQKLDPNQIINNQTFLSQSIGQLSQLTNTINLIPTAAASGLPPLNDTARTTTPILQSETLDIEVFSPTQCLNEGDKAAALDAALARFEQDTTTTTSMITTNAAVPLLRTSTSTSPHIGASTTVSIVPKIRSARAMQEITPMRETTPNMQTGNNTEVNAPTTNIAVSANNHCLSVAPLPRTSSTISIVPDIATSIAKQDKTPQMQTITIDLVDSSQVIYDTTNPHVPASTLLNNAKSKSPLNRTSSNQNIADLVKCIKMEKYRGKYLSCLEHEGRNGKYSLLEAIGKVFFHDIDLNELQFCMENVLNMSCVACTPEEEKAFVKYYALPLPALNCNKIVQIDTLNKHFEQLVYIFSKKGRRFNHVDNSRLREQASQFVCNLSSETSTNGDSNRTRKRSTDDKKAGDETQPKVALMGDILTPQPILSTTSLSTTNGTVIEID